MASFSKTSSPSSETDDEPSPDFRQATKCGMVGSQVSRGCRDAEITEYLQSSVSRVSGTEHHIKLGGHADVKNDQ